MRNSGFKVYEMIVVLAILMVLAGLLMPVLKKARQKTALDVCASNLSQIHQAVLLYEQEQGTLWEGSLSWVPGLRPYLGDTFLMCPLAPPRRTKPWERGTVKEQVEEYYIHGTPLPFLRWARDYMECKKRLGDRAPLVSCVNHLYQIPPQPNIFIRRSGQIVFVDEQTWKRILDRLFPLPGKPRRSAEDQELPCPKVTEVFINVP